MTYPLPSNVTKIVDLAVWTNSVTNQMFWPLILLGLFVILFFSFKGFQTERAFATSAFVTMIIGIMFGIMGLVSSYVVIFTMIVAAGAVIALRNSNNREY